MRKIGILGLLVTLACTGSSASAGSATVGGPFLLVRFPSLGTVTWRCDLNRRNAYALAYRASPPIATTSVRLRVSGRVVRSAVVNSTRLVRLPSVPARRTQQLELVQMTEPGTLRVSIRADFAAGRQFHCESYLPPRLDIRLLPR